MQTRSTPSRGRWLLLPLAVVVVAVGVWVTGGLVSDDEQVAKGLTAAWFALTGLVAGVVAWRSRPLAVPVLLGYGLSVAVLGGFLLYTSTVDQVADEDVVVAGEPDAGEPGAGDPSAGDGDGDGASTSSGSDADENRLVSRGSFTDGEHPTDGVASVVMTPDRHVLTLTMFATDPGPDLRVYLVPSGDEVSQGLDLGGLKGNKGDQQYVIPDGVQPKALEDASVVIWCRAFSVAFGTAELKA